MDPLPACYHGNGPVERRVAVRGAEHCSLQGESVSEGRCLGRQEQHQIYSPLTIFFLLLFVTLYFVLIIYIS